MGNARFVEHVAARDEPVARVERHRVDLRVEQDACVSARSRFVDQAPQQRTPRAASTPCDEHRHPADVAVWQQPRAADRLATRASRQRVQRRRIGIVPLERLGDALLDDEYRVTNRAQFARSIAPSVRMNAEVGAHR